ncbi:MAG: HAMP domain-containing protein [Opitutales bacterium]|nr:HAMP domain-containing protein [Opitutales bacterium]
MKSPLHSIRWRIQVWHGLLLLFVLMAFCLTAARMAQKDHFRRIDRDLERTEREIFHKLQHSIMPDDEKAPPMPPELLFKTLRDEKQDIWRDFAAAYENQDPGYVYFSIRDADGSVLLQTPNTPDSEKLQVSGEQGFTEEVHSIDNRREMVRGPWRKLHFIVGRDISRELEEMQHFKTRLFLTGLGVWMVSLLGGWLLAGNALKPIATISNTAFRIAEGNLEKRIDTSGNSELDELARVLNQTFDRLHTAFNRQKRFTADASHELRTPVTALLTESERILRRERSCDEYREAIMACHNSGRRMSQLIEALLMLSQQENSTVTKEQCDMGSILKDVVEQLLPLAEKCGVSVTCHSNVTPCYGDAAALFILARNLVANAIGHNHRGGHVWVESFCENQACLLKVSDDGPGIAEEDLPHIFERFYRADKARTGTSGHTGLGLAIVNAIAQKHDAAVNVESTLGHGALFTVRFPRH